MLEQIRSKNWKLKKLERDNKNILSIKMNNLPKNVENNLTNTLANAIAKRRKQLTKFDDSSDEKSDWSD